MAEKWPKVYILPFPLLLRFKINLVAKLDREHGLVRVLSHIELKPHASLHTWRQVKQNKSFIPRRRCVYCPTKCREKRLSLTCQALYWRCWSNVILGRTTGSTADCFNKRQMSIQSTVKSNKIHRIHGTPLVPVYW